MKPVDQTIFNRGGNCFAACLASLLECTLADVKGISEIYVAGAVAYDRTPDNDSIWSNCWSEVSHMIVKKFNQWPAVVFHKAPRGYALHGGRSPRGDYGHFVVVLDGQMVHDPHPDRTGLVPGGKEDWLILVPLV